MGTSLAAGARGGAGWSGGARLEIRERPTVRSWPRFLRRPAVTATSPPALAHAARRPPRPANPSIASEMRDRFAWTELSRYASWPVLHRFTWDGASQPIPTRTSIALTYRWVASAASAALTTVASSFLRFSGFMHSRRERRGPTVTCFRAAALGPACGPNAGAVRRAKDLHPRRILGFFLATDRSFSAASDGRLAFVSHAWMVLGLTLRMRANAACETRSWARTARISFAPMGGGGFSSTSRGRAMREPRTWNVAAGIMSRASAA